MTHDETTTVRMPKASSVTLGWLAAQVGCSKGELVELFLELALSPGMISRLRDMRLARLQPLDLGALNDSRTSS